MSIIVVLNWTNVAHAYYTLSLTEKEFQLSENQANEIQTELIIENKNPSTLNLDLHVSHAVFKGQKILPLAPLYTPPKLQKIFQPYQQSIQLESLETKRVPIKITIPANETPGTMYVSFNTIETNSIKSSTDSKASSAALGVYEYTTLQIHIPGKRINNYQVTPTTHFHDQLKNSISFSKSVKNTGNTILEAIPTLTIRDNKNNIITSFQGEKQIFSQDNTSTANFTWRDAPPYGNFQADFDLKISEYNQDTNQSTLLENYHDSTEIKIFSTWFLRQIAGYIFYALLAIIAIVASFLLHLLYRRYFYFDYTVAANDTVITLAKKFNNRWQTIIRVNHIKPPYDLLVGQIIKVKKAKNVAVTTKS